MYILNENDSKDLNLTLAQASLLAQACTPKVKIIIFARSRKSPQNLQNAKNLQSLCEFNLAINAFIAFLRQEGKGNVAVRSDSGNALGLKSG